MPPLASPKHEKFASLIASGKTASESYTSAGYRGRGAEVSGHRLLKNAKVRARIDELTEEISKGIVQSSIADKNYRIARAQELEEKIFTVFQERAAYYANRAATDSRLAKLQEPPGFGTGVVVETFRRVGASTVAEYTIDTAAIREAKELLKYVSQEVGDWTEKKEFTGKDGGPLTVELVDGWLAEADGGSGDELDTSA